MRCGKVVLYHIKQNKKMMEKWKKKWWGKNVWWRLLQGSPQHTTPWLVLNINQLGLSCQQCTYCSVHKQCFYGFLPDRLTLLDNLIEWNAHWEGYLVESTEEGREGRNKWRQWKKGLEKSKEWREEKVAGLEGGKKKMIEQEFSQLFEDRG